MQLVGQVHYGTRAVHFRVLNFAVSIERLRQIEREKKIQFLFPVNSDKQNLVGKKIYSLKEFGCYNKKSPYF